MSSVGSSSGASTSLVPRISNIVRVPRVSKEQLVQSVALLALANLPGAEGGPALFGACVGICVAAGGFLSACVKACAISAGLPTW